MLAQFLLESPPRQYRWAFGSLSREWRVGDGRIIRQGIAVPMLKRRFDNPQFRISDRLAGVDLSCAEPIGN